MDRSASKSELIRAIHNAQNIVVVSHIHPDGDAIGSLLAMGLGLELIGKSVSFYNRDLVPYNFQFLAGAEKVRPALIDNVIDLTILMDCAEPHRIGECFPKNGWGKTIAVIDHHKTFDDKFADIYFRDIRAAATGELVYEVLQGLDISISPEMAKCIYATLVTDTGSFRYSNTSKRTFQIAGELVELGVDPWEITSYIFESQPYERIELLARVLDTLDISECGRLAFLVVNISSLGNHDESIIDGFINYARSIKDVEVATQLLGDSNEWRVSFRSKGKIDVSEIAAEFGGGGHYNAAGCEIVGDITLVKEKLEIAFLKILNVK